MATQNVRVCTDIWSTQQTTVTASSEYNSKVAENVLVSPTSLRWESTTDSSEYLSGDLGQTRDINFISLLGVNFSQSTTVTIRYRLSTVSNFSTTVLDVTEAQTDVFGETEVFPVITNHWAGATVTARYWRIDITDASNTDTRLKIGRVIVGKYFEPEVNSTSGIQLSIISRDQQRPTAGNVLRVLTRPKKRRISLRMEHLSRTEATAFAKLSVGHEIFVSAFPELGSSGDTDDAEIEQQWTMVGTLQPDVPTSRITSDRNIGVLNILEDGAVGRCVGEPLNNIWLKVGNNLSDLDDVGTARDNLEIGEDFGRFNLLDNSDMRIAQRTTVSTLNTTSGVKAHDRWYIDFTQATTETFTVAEGFAQSVGSEYIGLVVPLQVYTSAAHGGIAITQRMENQWLSYVSGKTVSLSFWYKAEAAVTLDEIEINGNLDNGGTGDFSTAFTPSSAAYTSGGFVRYEGTATLSSISLTRGSKPYLELRIGSTSSQSAQWDNIQIAAPKLEIGDVATLWEPEPYGFNLMRCHRHYQNGGTAGGNHVHFYGDVTNSTDYYAQVIFLTRMLFAPTVTTTHASASSFPATASTVGTPGVFGFQAYRTANATAAAGRFRDSWTAATGW